MKIELIMKNSIIITNLESIWGKQAPLRDKTSQHFTMSKPHIKDAPCIICVTS